MNRMLCGLLVVAALLPVAGCNQASSPSTVANDVATARESAAKDDAKVSQEQAKTDAAANADAAAALNKADAKKADSAYEVAVTDAEGRHKIAIEKCNALAGDSQKACKDQADAALEMAKANAKATNAAAHS